jgi:hypothetical protein
MKNYDNNKTLFNYILSNKYEIIKDPNSNEIMKIISNNNEIKCKYNLLFTIEYSHKDDKQNNKLIWSYSNPYIDQKTKLISIFIKNALDNQYKNYWNWDNFSEKNVIELINIIIKQNLKIYYDGEFIDPIWIIKGDYSNYSQYYMITDIIYF